MFFLPTKETPILCQGMTSHAGAMYAELALSYGSHIVAGTSVDKNIHRFLGVPIFRTVAEAFASVNPKISVIFSTPQRALKDVQEAICAGLQMIICITEHVPMHEALEMKHLAVEAGVSLIGPASMGIGVIDQTIAGAIPMYLFKKGKIGIVSRSSSLLWEAAKQLSDQGLGVSTCISLGADHLIGTSFVPAVQALLADEKTQGILAIGQVHGQMEQELAHFYATQEHKKPLWFYIPGRSLERSEKQPLLGMKTVKFSDIIDEKRKLLETAGAMWIETPDSFGHSIKRGKKK